MGRRLPLGVMTMFWSHSLHTELLTAFRPRVHRCRGPELGTLHTRPCASLTVVPLRWGTIVSHFIDEKTESTQQPSDVLRRELECGQSQVWPLCDVTQCVCFLVC